MPELLQLEDPRSEILASQETIDVEFAEIVGSIDAAFQDLPAEQKQDIVSHSSGEKRIWNGDGQNNFGSES